MFSSGSGFDFARHSATIEWESAEGFAEFFFDRFGPLVTARQMLGERFPELADKLVRIFNERNEATDGSLLMPQEYLLAVIRL